MKQQKRSDIDLVAIGRFKLDRFIASLPKKKKINVVRFSVKRFDKLYQTGDLFIFHALTEGRILHGDKGRWSHLVKGFQSKDSASTRQIKRYQKLAAFLLSDRGNLKAPIAFLTNLLRAMKPDSDIPAGPRPGVYIRKGSPGNQKGFPVDADSHFERHA